MGVAVPAAGTGGHPDSGTPSKVWSWALVCWSTAISKSSFTKKIRVNPPPPLIKLHLLIIDIEQEIHSINCHLKVELIIDT